jgi:hypothetical protein
VRRCDSTAFPGRNNGSIHATVTRVATEVRDGLVQVEFTPAPTGNPVQIMQHGVPGVIEVAVEQAAPASLVFRAAGLLLSGPIRQTGAINAEVTQ